MRAGSCSDHFRRALRDDAATAVATFRPHIDHPVRCHDDVQVVLDDEQRAAILDQPLEGSEQFPDVVEVQAGGGLIADEEGSVVA